MQNHMMWNDMLWYDDVRWCEMIWNNVADLTWYAMLWCERLLSKYYTYGYSLVIYWMKWDDMMMYEVMPMPTTWSYKYNPPLVTSEYYLVIYVPCLMSGASHLMYHAICFIYHTSYIMTHLSWSSNALNSWYMLWYYIAYAAFYGRIIYHPTAVTYSTHSICMLYQECGLEVSSSASWDNER